MTINHETGLPYLNTPQERLYAADLSEWLRKGADEVVKPPYRAYNLTQEQAQKIEIAVREPQRTDRERLDWMERLAPQNDLRLECDGHLGEYQVWRGENCLGKGIDLREAIDAAMEGETP